MNKNNETPTNNPSSDFDFSQLLVEIYQKRRKLRPRYSLRAFAISLDINDSTLAQIMKGKRRVGYHVAQHLCKKMSLDFNQIEPFLNKRKKASSEPKCVLIDENTFEQVADWYYMALLELTKLDNFKPQISWISQELQVSEPQIEQAVVHLQSMGYLKIINGKWIDAIGDATNIRAPQFTNETLKKHQKQIAQASLHTIDSVPVHQRNHTTMFLTVSEQDLEVALKKLQRLRRQFAASIEKSKNAKNKIYALHMGFFPLSQ